jgi:hypothetical protein
MVGKFALPKSVAFFTNIIGVLFMKKCQLPILISLALSPTWILAQEAATSPAAPPETPAASEAPAASSTPAAAPATNTETTTETTKSKPQDLREKYQAHRDYMREQMDKLYQTDDPQERERIRANMQQHQQKMHQEMWQSGSMPGWGGDPRWGGPGWGGGPWSGPGPHWGGPQWDNSGPPWSGPRYYNMPPSRSRNVPPNFFDKKTFGGHQAKVEQRLENIEKILQQIADTLAKQAKEEKK